MKVSIIIPVYNAAPYLRRCLGSIACQTFRDFEVIAVDDGSTDESGAVLESFAGDLPLTVLRQPNGGQSVARNAALAVARGDYVLMVDADDFIHPRLLELAVGAADRGQLDFVMFDALTVSPEQSGPAAEAWTHDRSPVGEAGFPGPVFDWFVNERRWPTPWQFLFRRSTLAGRNFVPGVIYEDIAFVMSYLADHDRGSRLLARLYGYVRVAGSTTHGDDWERRIVGYETAMRTLRGTLDDRRYRLFVRCDCAGWIRCLWRSVLRLPRSNRRTELVRAMNAFLVRCAADGLIGAGDFKGMWRLRFLWTVLKVRRLPFGGGRARLASHATCSGCSACASVCPFGAIQMIRDAEGFAYPEIDEAKCRSCGKCRTACPSISRGRVRTPRLVLAARSKDEDLRGRASSGGLFPVMARHVIEGGGIVYGAAYDEKWTVRHRGVDTLEELPALSRSKYMESQIDGIYGKVLDQLKSGRRVLFSGTPCQVAGLLRTVGGRWPNLVTVEVFCGGVPSPRVWQTYLRHCQKVDGHAGIVSVDFRDKSRGWERPHLTIRYADGASRSAFLLDDSYQLAFFSALSTREGCHRCQVQSFRSGADISIGDFWGEGIVERHAALIPERGLSAVVLHTDRGLAFFGDVKEELQTESSSPDELRGQYDVLYKCRPAHRNRKEFFRRVWTEDFDQLVKELMSSRKRRKKKGA